MQTEPRDLPPVFFNHLYLVLDDKTYRAIQASDFLCGAFVGCERRATTTAAGERWSGTYFYGRDNYLEFFGETAGRHWIPGAQAGWAGLAFSTDISGGVAAIRQRLQETLGYQPFHELRQIDRQGKKTNWFYHVRLAESLDLASFDSWVMEYHPDVFEHKGIPMPPNGQPTRAAYLSPWSQSRKDSTTKGNRQVQPVFSRLIGATIHMDPPRAAKFGHIMQLLGYTHSEETGQIILSAHGFSLTVRLHLEDAMPPGYRLSSLRLAMERPSIAPMTFVFAPGSRLILREDQTADWLFGESS